MHKTHHKPRRLYHAQDIVDGVKTISALRQKAMDFTPPPVPTHEGYCVGCKGKKTFVIEKEETMKNKALRRSGKCPDCGTTVSAFAQGVQESVA